MKINITIETSDDCEIEVCKVEEPKKERVELSDYARFFDETSSKWLKGMPPEWYLILLRQTERYANDILKSRYKVTDTGERIRGHLFLNEVYDMLGLSRTKAGQVIGWIYDEKNPVGDNFVKFGIYEKHNMDFVNGYKDTALLDFNVDGLILDKI